ncbi:MAG: DUF1902 domain-containing protein [Pseudomonadota bacterium]
MAVMAGLVPAIHVFGVATFENVDARHEAGHHDRHEATMSKPVIFTVSAVWDADAGVWSGHCDEIPAAADAPTLDALLAKIEAMTLDLLPDNHPGVDPASVFLQITALREALPAA